MGVDTVAYQLRRALARVHRDYHFMDKVGCLRSDHVKAEDLVAAAFNDQLGKAGRGTEDLALGEVGIVGAGAFECEAITVGLAAGGQQDLFRAVGCGVAAVFHHHGFVLIMRLGTYGVTGNELDLLGELAREQLAHWRRHQVCLLVKSDRYIDWLTGSALALLVARSAGGAHTPAPNGKRKPLFRVGLWMALSCRWLAASLILMVNSPVLARNNDAAD